MGYVVKFFKDFFTEFHDFVQESVAAIPIVLKLALGRRAGATHLPRKPWRNRAFRFTSYWAWKRFWIAERRLQRPLKIKKTRTQVIVKEIDSGRIRKVGPIY